MPANVSEQKVSPGQRWVSHTEPELGLGVAEEFDGRKIRVSFPAAAAARIYTLGEAPIQRVRFQAGEEVPLQDGSMVTIDKVEDQNGLLYYLAGEQVFPETELSDAICFSKPGDRLLGGQVDDSRTFDLRAETLLRSAAIRKSPARGFLGGRIDLIPHQIAIVKEVASRLQPRVLLADEVGLGKTIEACLILHRLHLTGRADRVLILLPEPLMHQWFVELRRRFNFTFALFDEGRCRAMTEANPDLNPFAESSLVLASIDFLLANPHRIPQVIEAGWDLLIVDEAHHLEWSEDAPSEGYELVQALATETASVLLLTATPQQLGVAGHFARLQLLDPDRYSDLPSFLKESEDYEEIAAAVDALQAGETPKNLDHLRALSPRVSRGLDRLDDPDGRAQLVADLLDSFGPGRVMFRNTRRQLSGFPSRQAHLYPLEGEDELSILANWIVTFLNTHPEEKVLLICKTLDLVEDIAAALLDRISIKMAQFHEELSLLQRDRNAAFFAEPDGARILLCSEIGSEGRNFQFAHHLILFDLPEIPELLEQRIGRLDRIGQTGTIHIHVPYLKGSRTERYARWYSEGLDAFEHSLQGAQEILKILQATEGLDLEQFIEKSKELRKEFAHKMERGHDRLLAQTSDSGTEVEEMLSLIDDTDGDRHFETWVTRLLDHFGVHVEDLDDRAYLIKPGNVITDAFPDLPEQGLGVTFRRDTALTREEKAFLTADHPIVTSAIDLLLSSEAGNSSFGVWEKDGGRNLILETWFILECVAPAALQTDFFLPPTPIRIAVDLEGQDHSMDSQLMKARLRPGAHRKLLSQAKVTSELIPRMLEKAETLASDKSRTLEDEARQEATAHFKKELRRLRDLAEINPLVDEAEITSLESHRDAVDDALAHARVRLDAVRLVYQTPPND